MNKAQDFILYPYSGGDQITLQSSKRFIKANLKTGEGFINAKGCNYANSIKLALNPLKCFIPETILIEIQTYLWHNDGKDGNLSGCCSYEIKQLFSN